MTTTDLVILSSSPPKGPIVLDSDYERNITPPRRQAIHPQSSSPDLPSLSAILSRRTVIPATLKSGSKAAELPQGVDLGFLSTANLVKDRRFSLGEIPPDTENYAPKVQDTEQPPPPQPAGKLKKVTKRTDTIKAKPKDEPVAKKPRKRASRAAPKASAGILVGEDEGRPEAGGSNRALAGSEADGEGLNYECPLVRPEPKAVKPRARKAKNATSAEPGMEDAMLEPAKAKKQTRKKATDPGAKKNKNVTGTVSTHFNHATPEKEPMLAASRDIIQTRDKPLDLEPAVARRRSWTPVSPSKDAVPTSPTSATLERVDASTASQAARTSASVCDTTFTNLMNNFNYVHEDSDSVSAKRSRNEFGEALTKRRKIEVIDKPGNQARNQSKSPVAIAEQLVDHAVTPALPETSESPAKKDKGPKKKPRTITDLATSAYRPAAAAAADHTKSSNISKFFGPQNPVTEKPKPGAGMGPPKAPKRKRAPRQKSPVKKDGVAKPGKSAAKTKKVAKLISEKLLSPETAKRRMDAQDILFGTSSQLVREESPTFVRALQQTMQESDTTALAGNGNLETLHLRPRPLGSGFSLVGKRKGLWAAAARDAEETVTDGGADLPLSPTVLQMEGVDMAGSLLHEEYPLQQEDRHMDSIEIRSSSPPVGPAKQLLGTSDHLAPRESDDYLSDDARRALAAFHPPCGDDFDNLTSAQPIEPSSEFMDIDDIEDSELQPAQQVTPSAIGHLSPKASSTSPFRRQALQALSSSGNLPVLPKMPLDLSGMRFKSTLASKAVTEPPNLAPDPSVPPAKRPVGRPRKVRADTELPAPPKKSNGRKRAISPPPMPAPTTPRKANSKKKPSQESTGWANIDEIEDSQDETTPSPPRRKNITKSPPLSLAPSEEPTFPSAVLNSTINASIAADLVEDLRKSLFPRISSTIKDVPPTKDATRPSWHEKILLYDPIVVEDLAEFLNGEGLRIKVSIKVPKAKPKKSKAKKKEEGEQEEIDEEIEADLEEQKTELHELPAWIVQKWCEEHSVCCMYRESLRNGRRSKW